MTGKKYKKILIATDGSEYADRARLSGIDIAKKLDAKVYAVCVVPTHPSSSMPIGSRMMRWDVPFKIMMEEATKAVEQIADACSSSGVEVETVILEGHPAEEIIKYAEDSNMDLIVMGSLGKTGLTRLLIGSVAEEVLRHSKVDVMVSK
ncbi:MAG: universal stress protein [Methanococcoides sp.]|uniref:Universal stress protein n=1 Tax=Methanococcoides seepicolus TaxID=2828780 RepID=A0A9E5DBQ9_9EURY|nr:universal stress protein [Methanococcoides seepicolus]NOQ47639.1 universal stress protein [Methanococcoides sp.]